VPKVDRNNPRRSRASESTYTLMDFMREFPDDATCLQWLWRQRCSEDGTHAHCPKCKQTRKFHKVRTRPSWSCDSCGHHVHPTAGTIFHGSATSLQLWFYAMYLMTSTRCAVSAKHLERELGVTYKTAWRMANLIRNKLMVEDGDEPLSGDVEADEMFIGGKPKAADRARARRLAPNPGQVSAFARRPKTAVFGAVQRGGEVRATVIPDSQAHTLAGQVKRFVLPEARLITDEWRGYTLVGREYAAHDTIEHGAHVYVSGDVHTNSIEGFFGNVKTGIAGNYHSVSRKWLQGYLNEFVWRYNRRYVTKQRGRKIIRIAGMTDRAMFLSLIDRATVDVER
jgi:transposase